MTPEVTLGSMTTGYTQDYRKCRMRYALALSLALHIGAAIILIIAGSFSLKGRYPQNFSIQEIELSPTITTPAKTTATPPEQHPAMISTTPTAIREMDNVQEPATEQATISTGSSEREGGLMSTSLGLGMTHGFFSGLSDGRTLRDDIRGYYFDMVAKINREWWDQAGLLKEPIRQDGFFELSIQRDGTLVSIRMLKGTGSSEADRLLAEIIRKASPLPALPSTYDQGMFQAPLRIKSPSFLFRLGS
jgi:hypothetical protein